MLAEGVTPSASTPQACATGIATVATNKYNSGRSQGRQDVGTGITYKGGWRQGMSGSHNFAVDANHYAIIVEPTGVTNPSSCITSITGANIIGSPIITESLNSDACILTFVKTTSNTLTVQKNAMRMSLYVIQMGLCQ